MAAPAILLIGNYCQTVTVVRSLGRAGYRVVLGVDGEMAFSRYSRHTHEVWRHPDIEKSEADFIVALAGFLAERRDIGLVFPVGETDIACLLRNPDVVPPSVGLVMADPLAVEACFDKLHLYEVVSRLGIPQAPFRRVSGYAELESAVGELGHPCVVKPNNSRAAFFGMKAVIVTTPVDLSRKLPAWPKGNEFLIVQRFASGYRHNCHFVADRGRLLSYFEQRVLRTDAPDGTGAGVHGISYPPGAKLRDYCARLTRQLDYSGAGCVQFLVDDPSGAVKFLELNPRLDATCAVPFHCGYDFPLMAVQYAEYRRGARTQAPENFTSYPVDRHGVSLWRDVLGWRQSVKAHKLGPGESRAWLKDMARTFWRGDFHLTWSWKDPLPTCYRYLRLLASAFGQLGANFGLGPRS